MHVHGHVGNRDLRPPGLRGPGTANSRKGRRLAALPHTMSPARPGFLLDPPLVKDASVEEGLPDDVRHDGAVKLLRRGDRCAGGTHAHANGHKEPCNAQIARHRRETPGIPRCLNAVADIQNPAQPCALGHPWGTPTTRLPCRRSWVRIPSSASRGARCKGGGSLASRAVVEARYAGRKSASSQRWTPGGDALRAELSRLATDSRSDQRPALKLGALPPGVPRERTASLGHRDPGA
jgi:hypothetical protein